MPFIICEDVTAKKLDPSARSIAHLVGKNFNDAAIFFRYTQFYR